MKIAIFCIAILFGALQAQPKIVAKFGQESCLWSQELRKEVWDSSIFQALLEGAGILKEESTESRIAEELPTLILVSSEGEQIGRLGFLLVPPEKYVDLIKEMLSIYTVCQSAANLEVLPLLNLYRKAQVLQMTACEKKLLQEGLKKDQGVDFLIAEYASLASAHPRRARQVKQTIRQKFSHSASAEWEMALISFQARQEQKMSLEKTTLPIKKFLRKFGAENPEYAWKCHFILAEFYKKEQQEEKMKIHLKAAQECAPDKFNKIIDMS